VAHGAAVHGLPFSSEPVELARIALKWLGLVGKGNERDRRPNEEEIDALLRHFRSKNVLSMPVQRIIRFAIATTMRQDEICRVAWSDVNARTRTLLIRDRKDRRKKKGNDQAIPLLSVTGYDAWAILEEQRNRRGSPPHLSLQWPLSRHGVQARWGARPRPATGRLAISAAYVQPPM
jgi:integrase